MTATAELLGNWISLLATNQQPNAEPQATLARGVKAAARGMLMLAHTGNDHIRLVGLAEDMGERAFPFRPFLRNTATMIVVLNQNLECGCKPVGSDVFGLNGKLRLRAVTLQLISTMSSPVDGQLNLVLSHGKNSADYTVVTILLDGSIKGTCYFFNPDNHLLYALGLVEPRQLLDDHTMVSSSDFDELTSFNFPNLPHATSYFADALPNLGEYFTDLAEKLSSGHTH